MVDKIKVINCLSKSNCHIQASDISLAGLFKYEVKPLNKMERSCGSAKLCESYDEDILKNAQTIVHTCGYIF